MKRIQRSRKKGWKKPENTINVDRNTKFGNPFMLLKDCIYVDASYRRTVFDKWVFFSVGKINDVVYLYEEVLAGRCIDNNSDMQYWINHFAKLDYSILAGRDLMCWCGLYEPCHANVLIEHVKKLYPQKC